MAANAPSAQSEAYLDLLIGCLSRTVIPEYYEPFRAPTNSIYRWLYACIPIRRFLQIKGLKLVRCYKMEPNRRLMGKDWPPDAETMIGLKRLDIVDDYLLKRCKATINDYRAAHGITDPMVDIDGSAIYWRRRTQ
jgi:hypothetical protein